MLSGTAILALLPILSLVALSIWLEDKSPVFYAQARLGLHGKIIHILKFRSMTHRPERKPGEAGELIGQNPEITRIGELLRRLKIDELPQLISVFRGDMSLVGPRPCLPELADDFDTFGRKRLEVRPGCTGLAQVNGNIHLSWQERWKYDAYYVDHLSFLLDVRILFKTCALLLRGEDKFVIPFAVYRGKLHRGEEDV